MKTYHSNKWNINADMGFIEVDINFFIDLKINSQTFHDQNTLTKIETNEGNFVIEMKDWSEIQYELRIIKLDDILGK